MAEAGQPKYGWGQRALDAATLWLWSSLLAAVLRLVALLRGKPENPQGPC
jgi:hypothetical protein